MLFLSLLMYTAITLEFSVGEGTLVKMGTYVMEYKVSVALEPSAADTALNYMMIKE